MEKEKKLILIADDEPYVREAIRAMVEELGDFDIVEAEDGRSLIDIAKRIRPDLIITDIVMPDIDAYHAIRELKADKNFRDTPVIFQSAMVKDKIVFETLKPPGPSAFLVKPFKFDELKEILSGFFGS
ncbi:MAG: response regulator transcription factor [Elusimicrobia bacterium]|nr:response regulator transcription factor [Elusimicrobiota bacterium]